MFQSLEHSASSLYCGEDAGEAVTSDTDAGISVPPSCIHLLPSDEVNVDALIKSERRTMPREDYLQRCRDRSINLTARQDSINWILKVHAHYHFSPVTALLTVNYFDRFLSEHSLPDHKTGWPFQLLSVACLSLAAKMEETYVPLLLDLQILDPKFVFEPKTVQRMELWVMSNLSWRLRAVTPFDYLHLFISKLPSSSSRPDRPTRILSSSSDLILRTIRVIDFLGYPPSTVAAAAVLCAAGESADSPVAFHERLTNEMVRSCHQLMEEYLVDTCPSAELKAAEAEQDVGPPSPVGVLDAAACGSCDTRSENPGSSSQAEPPTSKRLRSSAPDVQEQEP